MLQFRETFKQLTPEWHRLIVYSHSSADKKGAFTESLIIYVPCRDFVPLHLLCNKT